MGQHPKISSEMRVPPHSCETEQYVLGSLLLYPELRVEAKLLLPEGSFYRDAHNLIYAAILDSQDGDTLTVTNTMKRHGTIEKAGGIDYVFQLAIDVPISAGFKAHVKELIELYQQRETIVACHEAISNSHTGFSSESIIGDLRAKLRDIESKGHVDRAMSNKDVLKAVWNDIEKRVDSGKREVGVLTGYNMIDDNLMGLEPKSLILLIGRPSMGKTALALNIADNISKTGTVLFFSLEMGVEALTRRTLASETGVYLSRIRSGNLDHSHIKQIIDGMDQLGERKILTLDHSKWKKVEMLTGMAEKINSEQRLSAIFVDHIQLMRSVEKFQNRHLEISYISDGLKSLAKNIEVPVIALSQLNRKFETRKDKRPQLEDMKESGDLEQDADVVLGIYRSDRESEVMEIACLKGRDVGLWRGDLHFNRFTQKIRNWGE